MWPELLIALVDFHLVVQVHTGRSLTFTHSPCLWTVHHAAICLIARQCSSHHENSGPYQHQRGLCLIEVGCVWLQASLIGMQRQMAVSVRSCGICGEDLQDFGAVMSAREVAAGGTSEGSRQGTVQLGCKHCFHPDCIRGWAIVGKKVCDACTCLTEQFQACIWKP